MRRKIIQIADSTQLVSLPRAWSKKFGIKKGDEVDIQEQNDKLLISTDRGFSVEGKEIDITDLDTSSILHRVQGAYKLGYDDIKVIFSKPLTIDFETGKKVKVTDVVKKTVDRLIGVEIISQKDGHCVIKDISATSFKEFENVLRRIFLLLIDMSDDTHRAVAEKDIDLLKTIKEKHDTITKFVSFCLRLLNKKGYEDYKKTPSLYHIVASLDKITDSYKYIARELIANDCKVSAETHSIMEGVNKSLKNYYDIYYKFDQAKIVDISRNRRLLLSRMQKKSDDVPAFDVHMFGRFTSILDIILDLTETRMSIEQ